MIPLETDPGWQFVVLMIGAVPLVMLVLHVLHGLALHVIAMLPERGEQR